MGIEFPAHLGYRRRCRIKQPIKAHAGIVTILGRREGAAFDLVGNPVAVSDQAAPGVEKTGSLGLRVG
jgi:hypothetical protein